MGKRETPHRAADTKQKDGLPSADTVQTEKADLAQGAALDAEDAENRDTAQIAQNGTDTKDETLTQNEQISAASTGASVSACNKKKNRIFTVKIFNYRLIYLFMLCLIMSFIGFLVENVFRLFRDGVINSRRQILPFLFAYGIAVFAMYVLIGTPREMRFLCWKIFKKNSKLTAAGKYVCYFLIVMAFIFFGEMMFGTFVEWASGIVLWDYTGIPLRFTKYTSIPTALGLTVGIILFMRFVFEPLMRKLEKIPEKAALVIDLVLGIPIVLDWILMLVLMFGFGISKNWWNINVW